jgi:FAD/FMN-containing dehydrogenase
VQKLIDEYKLIYTIAGHPGNGNFHIIPLMDLNNALSADIILELSKKVYDLVHEYHGSITAEHNDGIIRTPYLVQMFGENMVALFRQTKNIFDPEHIFNPGKKVGGTFADIRAAIRKNT